MTSHPLESTKTLAKIFSIITVAAYLLFGGTCPLRAQSDSAAALDAPVLPMAIHLRYEPRYFVQRIDTPFDSSTRYSRIEALVDDTAREPWYLIVLTDRQLTTRVFYCNSQRWADVLRRSGEEAHLTPIAFSVVPFTNDRFAYRFEFRDVSGQPIAWRLVAGPALPQPVPAPLPRPDVFELTLLVANRRSRALAGTRLLVGHAQYVANLDDPVDAAETFYAEDLAIAVIAPGAVFWRTESAPAALAVGKAWILRDNAGRHRSLRISSISGNQVVVEQQDEDDSDSAPVQLQLLRSGNGFLLQSIILAIQSHALTISFDGALPLPRLGQDDSANLAFVINEDGRTRIASGTLNAVRRGDSESVTWQFDAPEWARTDPFQTGAIVVPLSDSF